MHVTFSALKQWRANTNVGKIMPDLAWVILLAEMEDVSWVM